LKLANRTSKLICWEFWRATTKSRTTRMPTRMPRQLIPFAWLDTRPCYPDTTSDIRERPPHMGAAVERALAI